MATRWARPVLAALLFVLAVLAGGLALPRPAAADPLEELRAFAAAGRLDPEILAALERDGHAAAILVLHDRQAAAAIEARRADRGEAHDDAQAQAEKAAAFAGLKGQALRDSGGASAIVRDYAQFGVAVVRLDGPEAARAALRRPQVAALRADRPHTATLSQSLALIRQPQAQGAGHAGAGTAVAVLDTGVDYTRAPFNCTAPGAGSGCRVPVARDFAADDSQRDDPSGHGTNVAGIVAAVAPATRILALDVFTDDSAWSSDILAALNWVVANKQAYGIAAASLSLGDDSYWTSACAGSWAHSAFSNLRATGVLPVVAAGNGAMAGGSFQNGVSSPACTPGAVSVGAVYDAAFGSIGFSSCSDVTAADKVTCFAQSGPTLSLLAPGAMIQAAGLTMSGTSQAAPHVSGAVAVLAGACATKTAAQREATLTGSGPSITDPRNGVTRRRLDLYAAVQAQGTCSAAPSPTASPTAGATRPPGGSPTPAATATPCSERYGCATPPRTATPKVTATATRPAGTPTPTPAPVCSPRYGCVTPPPPTPSPTPVCYRC